MAGPQPIMKVLGDAGWITPAAGPDKVLLMREGENGGMEKVYHVNVASLMDGSDMSQNVIVQAGDVILVPPSDAVTANRWIDQHIRQMLPLTPSLGLSWDVNGNN
jgi:hypothetical protein